MIKKGIVFLGTAATIPHQYRYTQSIAICSLRECILLDAGEGAQIRLSSAGIDHTHIKLVAITHVHGDHIHGLIPFLESLALKISAQGIPEKVYEIKIIGPTSLCKYLNYVLAIIGHNNVNEDLSVSCVEAKAIYDSGGAVETPFKEIGVAPLPVVHRAGEAYGYYVDVRIGKGRCIGVFYSGDGLCTDDCENRLRALKPAIIIHEATFLDYPNDKAKAAESLHATVYEAAKLAKDVGASVLVLTHISARYKRSELSDYIARARRYFDGDIFVAEDLALLPLDFLVY